LDPDRESASHGRLYPVAVEEPRKGRFFDYLRSWSDLGISQIQFNVLGRETLLETRRFPEKHTDLLARVADHGACFADFSKELQNSIIVRTEQAFA